ncbi:unnamed protein product [Caenorhabditis sp. 36 PRJEB53466]|nr:unnamed protein product [Caenorhabditis sp. 36 PRJEB53466]
MSHQYSSSSAMSMVSTNNVYSNEQVPQNVCSTSRPMMPDYPQPMSFHIPMSAEHPVQTGNMMQSPLMMPSHCPIRADHTMPFHNRMPSYHPVPFHTPMPPGNMMPPRMPIPSHNAMPSFHPAQFHVPMYAQYPSGNMMPLHNPTPAVNAVSANCNERMQQPCELQSFRIDSYSFLSDTAHPDPTLSLPASQKSSIVVSLIDEKKLWSKYCGMPNEMMVLTTGRELFPKLKYDVVGLKRNSQYQMTIHLKRISKKFMKYEEDEWIESSKPVDGPSTTDRFTVGTMSGEEWMMIGIDAARLKIYNIGNPKKVGGKPVDPNNRAEVARAAAKAQKLRETLAMSIEVKSLIRYMPVLTIWEFYSDGLLYKVKEFEMPETQFLTCTGYKNPLIRDMKSSDNKYVSGLPSYPDFRSPVVTAAPFQMDGQVMAASTSDVVRWDPDSPTNSSGYSSDRTSYSPEFVPAPSTHHYVPTPAPYHPIPYPPAQPDLYYSHVPFEQSP